MFFCCILFSPTFPERVCDRSLEAWPTKRSLKQASSLLTTQKMAEWISSVGKKPGQMPGCPGSARRFRVATKGIALLWTRQANRFRSAASEYAVLQDQQVEWGESSSRKATYRYLLTSDPWMGSNMKFNTRHCKGLIFYFLIIWVPVLLIGIEKAIELHG